jgi:hypothetical protein
MRRREQEEAWAPGAQDPEPRLHHAPTPSTPRGPPTMKSLGSCAGVILTAPVPKAMSTSSASQMIGMRRPLMGCTTCLPWRCL